MNTSATLPTSPATQFDCVIANTAQERDQVYRLRYACYRLKDAIDQRTEEHFSDDFDRLANSFSFLVRRRDEPLATVRVTVVKPEKGWNDSPVQHVYGDHPALQAIARESFVEASRLCFGRQARRGAFVGLVGHMSALAELHEAEWLVACPREEHAHIYQKMFGFRPLAAPRQYFGVRFKTQLLAIRRSELRDYVSGVRSLTEAWADALRRLKAQPMHTAS